MLAFGAVALLHGHAVGAPDYGEMALIYAETLTADEHCEFQGQVDIILSWADTQLSRTVMRQDVTTLVIYALQNIRTLEDKYRIEGASAYCDALKFKYGAEGAVLKGALVGNGRPKN